MKILIIEDDPSLREIIRTTLEKEGINKGDKILIFKQNLGIL